MSLGFRVNLLLKKRQKVINNLNDINAINNTSKKNKKPIKMKKSLSSHEERGGNERQVKRKYRQKPSKKIQRILRKKPPKQIKASRRTNKKILGGKKVSSRNIPLEANTRHNIDTKLINLGWILDEKNPKCNVFKEQPKTEEEKKLLRGNFPDYVL